MKRRRRPQFVTTQIIPPKLPRQARLPYQGHPLRQGVLVSMLALCTALLGAKTSLLEMGVPANQRHWQHLTSASLEQLLQVCGLCMIACLGLGT